MKAIQRVREHWHEATKLFPEPQMVGIFLQGAQNYGVDTPASDVDTRLLILPSVEDMIFAKQPKSYTHILANEEHIDVKDMRMFFETVRKQNLNFVEILFTEFAVINPNYSDAWAMIADNRELIAHYNRGRALATMLGQCKGKYNDMCKVSPAREAKIKKFGYDPKSFHHLLRIYEFMERYLAGESYASCLKVSEPTFHKRVKEGAVPYATAQKMADETLNKARILVESLPQDLFKADPSVEELLVETQRVILTDYLRKNV